MDSYRVLVKHDLCRHHPPRLILLSWALQFRHTLSLVQSNCSRSNINEKRLMDALQTTRHVTLRPWQIRTHGCGHTVADTNVFPFVRARNICCGHKKRFLQKHFPSATNVCQFAMPKKHHGQQCVLPLPGPLGIEKKSNLMICIYLFVVCIFYSNRGSRLLKSV